MVVDQRARDKILQNLRDKQLIAGITDGVGKSIKSIIIPPIKQDKKVLEGFERIEKGIVLLYKAIKGVNITVPDTQTVKGRVKVDEMPSIKVKNLDDLSKYFGVLEQRIGQLAKAISMVKDTKPEKIDFSGVEKKLSDVSDSLLRMRTQEIKMPEIKIPPIEVPNNDKIFIKVLKEIKDALKSQTQGVTKVDNSGVEDAMYRVETAINTLASRPQMTAQPVTNININALNGVFNSTLVMVGGTATKLPPYNLANRRTIILYNNDASNTFYIGGPTVASSGTGIGAPIAPQSYSPPFDAGSSMNIYGITSGSSIQVIVLEMSSENSGR